jgi:TolA-binding protein
VSRIRVSILLLAAALPLLVAGPRAASAQSQDETVPYEQLMRAIRMQSPQDTLGNGALAAAMRTYEAGRFDEAIPMLQAFANTYPRNLGLSQALETLLLIRGNREFQDEPLRIYVRAETAWKAGHPDSAAAEARAGLERFPGARIRDHWNYLLAQVARDRGDHASAIGYAMAVADTAAKSRLAPYALKLAAEETLALGTEPSRALHLYQDLLERYPDSPIAPQVRARALELRKRFQL